MYNAADIEKYRAFLLSLIRIDISFYKDSIPEKLHKQFRAKVAWLLDLIQESV